MLNYIEYLKIPAQVSIVLVAVFFILQLVEELLSIKIKIIPEFMRVKEYFKRKKKEKEALSQMTDLLNEYKEMKKTISDVQKLLIDIDKHYNNDNIIMRNDWMNNVNEHISTSEEKNDEQDSIIRMLIEKLDENIALVVDMSIENKRNAIIAFASRVIDENYLVTREQFNRVLKMHEEYEEIIKDKKRTNGEVDIAFRIINESYEKHMKNHTFVEDVRGYNN